MASESKSPLVLLGDRISARTSSLFAHPAMQMTVVLFCVGWFALGMRADLLTAALSILAITLAQMVLNGQYDREVVAHRRDVAMHAKLDELIIATKRARDEMVGIEELDEEKIAELKDQAKQAIDAQGARAGDPGARAVAKAAVNQSAFAVAQRRKRTTLPRRGRAV